MSESSILSYIDTVVSTYDSSSNEAEFKGLNITEEAKLKDTEFTGKIEVFGGGTLSVDGIIYPTLLRSSLSTGDTLVWDETKDDSENNAGGAWVIRNLDQGSTSIDNIGGVLIDTAAPTGTLVLLDTTAGISGAPGFIANKSQEFRFLDGKPSVTPEQLKLTDRLLVAVDKPGSSTPTLYKMSISSLFQFIEKSNADLSSLRGLGSNTILNTLTTSIEVGVDDGVLTRMSGFDADGFIMHGSLRIKNDDDGENLFLSDGYTPIPTSAITKVLNGFDITTTESGLLKLRIGTNKSLEINDVIKIGLNQLTINKLSRLEIESNTAITFGELDGGLAAAYLFDQTLNKSADVLFNKIALTDTLNVEGVFTANGTINSNDLTATSVTSNDGTFENLEANTVNFFPGGKTVLDLFNPSIHHIIRINELQDTTIISANNNSTLEFKTLDQSVKFNRSGLLGANMGVNGLAVGSLNTLNASDTVILSNMTMSPANWTPNILAAPGNFESGALNNVDRNIDQTQAQDAAEALIGAIEVGYMWCDEVARPYIDGGILKNELRSSTYYNPADAGQDKRILISTPTPDFALASDVKYYDAYSMEQNLQNSDGAATIGAGHMIDYSAIVPILVAANQKLMTRATELESKVTALESKVTALESA